LVDGVLVVLDDGVVLNLKEFNEFLDKKKIKKLFYIFFNKKEIRNE